MQVSEVRTTGLKKVSDQICTKRSILINIVCVFSPKSLLASAKKVAPGLLLRLTGEKVEIDDCVAWPQILRTSGLDTRFQ